MANAVAGFQPISSIFLTVEWAYCTMGHRYFFKNDTFLQQTWSTAANCWS